MSTITKPAQPCDAELWVMAGKYPAIPAQQFIDVARDVLNNFSAGQDAARAEPVVTLTGAQLLQALDFIAPDRDTDPEQLEGDLTIAYGDGHGYAGKGYYCWLTDYPDEGSIPLDAEAPDAPAAPTSAEPVVEATVCGYTPGLCLVELRLPAGWRLKGLPLELGDTVIISAAPVAAQAQTISVPCPSNPAQQSDRDQSQIMAALRVADDERLLSFSAKEVRGLLNTIKNQQARIKRFERNHAAQAQPALPSLPERKAAIEEVVGTCNRIPGANTWNAAELMYDLLTAQAQQSVSGADGLDERKAFEAWATSPDSDENVSRHEDGDIWDGEYVDVGVQQEWRGWQARAALAQQANGQIQWVQHPDITDVHDDVLTDRGKKIRAAQQAAGNTETVACGCGDMFPASSYGAGFIAATGHCENCDAAQGTDADKVDADLLRYLLRGCIETDENGWLQIRFETARHRSNHDIGESAQWVREDIIDAARKEQA